MLKENDVQIVTLDITMPCITGMELLQRIKGEWDDVEVIMLTGTGHTQMAIDALTR